MGGERGQIGGDLQSRGVASHPEIQLAAPLGQRPQETAHREFGLSGPDRHRFQNRFSAPAQEGGRPLGCRGGRGVGKKPAQVGIEEVGKILRVKTAPLLVIELEARAQAGRLADLRAMLKRAMEIVVFILKIKVYFILLRIF